MEKRSLLFYFLQGLLPFIYGQQRTAGPWRHRVQWENNGQVYSLLSTGSQYHTPVQSNFHVSGSRDGTTNKELGAHRRAGQAEGRYFRADQPSNGAPGRDVTQQAPVNGGASGSRQQNVRPHGTGSVRSSSEDTNSSSSGGLTSVLGAREAAYRVVLNRDYESGLGAQNQPLRAVAARMLVSRQRAQAPFPAFNLDASTDDENMVNDDPRIPFKSHGNSLFYNMNPGGRSVTRSHRLPAAGFGTSYFQNGLPDLLPDPYAIQAGAYIQRMQMYALRCAAEENCLARSAYAPTIRDIDFRVLLRFPQKVKNQGTADFLPVKPRYQWDWHSCHQHYHSMDAFSNYDLLDIVTGRKVAEGHKASFCLEDTGCDHGFRRRYACTSHTQGLSPGCHDTYAANIDCQWIDITDVPPGNYILKITVNPNFLILESDFTNNIVKCEITYTGLYVQTRNCRISSKKTGHTF
uniref:Lysyl oxidase homolog n=1 Tax=Nothobranchius furzeri TaxID=105023 RepID=A0A8C6KYY1_NOTFU